MKDRLRTIIFPVACLFFVLGFLSEQSIFLWILSGILFVLSFVFYSHRKQRIRYWFQGYEKYLQQSNGDKHLAIASVLNDFSQSKYADKDICARKYSNISELIQEIIIREFKFHIMLDPSTDTPEEVQEGMVKYQKVLFQLQREIGEVKKENNYDCLERQS